MSLFSLKIQHHQLYIRNYYVLLSQLKVLQKYLMRFRPPIGINPYKALSMNYK